MEKKYHTNSRRPDEYYSEVLRILIACNNEAMTYEQMAAKLNTLTIPTPTGLRWKSDHIKNLLKKLRHYRQYPSRIAQHMLELIFEGSLSIKETIPLMQSRRHGVK